MNLRQPSDIVPVPTDPEDILRLGLGEIAAMPAGGHLDPDNHCYGEKRELSAYASAILAQADAARGAS